MTHRQHVNSLTLCNISGALTSALTYYRAALLYDTSHIHTTTERLAVPVLTIWGKRDVYLDCKMAEASSKYMRDYTLKFIENGGHSVHMENPELVNRHIRNFVFEQIGF